jgi:gas vesicle protein
MAEERADVGGMMVAFLAGGLIGAGLALILAPLTGSETRQKIGDIAEDVKKKAEVLADDLKKKSDEWKKKAESVVDMEKRRARTESESVQDVLEGPS